MRCPSRKIARPGNRCSSEHMPTERRRIIFSDDEIVSAALAHCRATGVPIPDAEVEEQLIETDSDCGLILTFAVSSPDQIDEVRLDADSVLTALISYCRMQSIPLPRQRPNALTLWVMRCRWYLICSARAGLSQAPSLPETGYSFNALISRSTSLGFFRAPGFGGFPLPRGSGSAIWRRARLLIRLTGSGLS